MGPYLPGDSTGRREEERSDAVAVSNVCDIFPKVYGSILKSHIRSLLQQTRNRAAGVGGGRPALVTTAALSGIVKTIHANVDANSEFTTSELPPAVLAKLEVRHPSRFQASLT